MNKYFYSNLICTNKQVSWVRRKPGESGLELLTVGQQTYSGDSRYKVEFQYPNNWKLKIESVVKEDEGTYECQISTYPPRVIQKNIFIIGKYVRCANSLFVLRTINSFCFFLLVFYLKIQSNNAAPRFNSIFGATL